MNVNLKNRPRNTKRKYRKGTCAPDIEAMLEWFEGFEKELRQMLVDYSLSSPDADRIIEEILGES